VEDDRPPPPGEPLVGRHHPQIERVERLDERVEKPVHRLGLVGADRIDEVEDEPASRRRGSRCT
jgi:hypothetical protein